MPTASICLDTSGARLGICFSLRHHLGDLGQHPCSFLLHLRSGDSNLLCCLRSGDRNLLCCLRFGDCDLRPGFLPDLSASVKAASRGSRGASSEIESAAGCGVAVIKLVIVEDMLDPLVRQYGRRGRDALVLSRSMPRCGVQGSDSVHGSDGDADDRSVASSCVLRLSTSTSTAPGSTGTSGPLSVVLSEILSEVRFTIDATDTLMCARFQRGTSSSPLVARTFTSSCPLVARTFGFFSIMLS